MYWGEPWNLESTSFEGCEESMDSMESVSSTTLRDFGNISLHAKAEPKGWKRSNKSHLIAQDGNEKHTTATY